jgi:hypothetical protein
MRLRSGISRVVVVPRDDDDLGDASPSLLPSSSSAFESLLDCSLLRYRPTDNKDHKDHDDGEAAAPRGPGASVPGLLGASSCRPVRPPPTVVVVIFAVRKRSQLRG